MNLTYSSLKMPIEGKVGGSFYWGPEGKFLVKNRLHRANRNVIKLNKFCYNILYHWERTCLYDTVKFLFFNFLPYKSMLHGTALIMR